MWQAYQVSRTHLFLDHTLNTSSLEDAAESSCLGVGADCIAVIRGSMTLYE